MKAMVNAGIITENTVLYGYAVVFEEKILPAKEHRTLPI